MPALSSAAWVVHDAGLAASIGGTLFGRAALEPALCEISDPHERDLASARAWKRFAYLDVASHLAFAVPWIVGRRMRTGREVSAAARALTRAKDALVGVSLVTGIASHVLGKRLGDRIEEGEELREGSRPRRLQRVIGALGNLNLFVNTTILGITALLAMEGSKSVRFTRSSRRLP